MKRFLKFLWLILLLIPLVSCKNAGQRTQITGTGEYVTQEIETRSATILNVSDIQIRNNENMIPVRLYLEYGDTKSVSITAQKEVLDSIVVDDFLDSINIQGRQKSYFVTEYVEIHVRGYKFQSVRLNLTNAEVATNTLSTEATITLDEASRFNVTSFQGKELTLNADQSSEIRIDAIEVERLNTQLNESSSVAISSVKANEAKLTLQGGAELSIDNLVSKRVTINANDASNCTLVGSVTNIDLVFSGSSIYNGKGCLVEMATILTSNNANIVLSASKGINIVASGASTVTYYGDAAVTSTSITGQSQIIRGE